MHTGFSGNINFLDKYPTRTFNENKYDLRKMPGRWVSLENATTKAEKIRFIKDRLGFDISSLDTTQIIKLINLINFLTVQIRAKQINGEDLQAFKSKIIPYLISNMPYSTNEDKSREALANKFIDLCTHEYPGYPTVIKEFFNILTPRSTRYYSLTRTAAVVYTILINQLNTKTIPTNVASNLINNSLFNENKKLDNDSERIISIKSIKAYLIDGIKETEEAKLVKAFIDSIINPPVESTAAQDKIPDHNSNSPSGSPTRKDSFDFATTSTSELLSKQGQVPQIKKNHVYYTTVPENELKIKKNGPIATRNCRINRYNSTFTKTPANEFSGLIGLYNLEVNIHPLTVWSYFRSIINIDYKSSRTITELKLVFDFRAKFNKELKDQLLGELKKYKNLRILKLDFYDTVIDDNMAKKLINGVKVIKSLAYLSLNFRHCSKLTDVGIESIAQALGKMENLTELGFTLNNCSEITDTGMESIAQALGKIKKITKLKLYFGGIISKFTDIGIESIAQALGKMGNLTELGLNASSYITITDIGAKSLAQALGKIKKITKLKLYFGGAYNIKFTDIGIKSITQALGEMENLTELGLKVSSYNTITDIGAQSVAQALGKIKKITKLKLHFGRYSTVTDIGMKSIIEILKQLNELKSLKLKFSSLPNSQIKNKIVNTICERLSMINRLETLSLDFSYCNFTAAMLKKLTTAIITFDQLRNLELDFSHCNERVDAEVGSIAKAIGTLKELRTLTLKCKMDNICTGINNKWLKELVENLKDSEKIFYLHLDFEGCDKISQEEFNKLTQNRCFLLTYVSRRNNYELLFYSRARARLPPLQY